MEKYSYVDLGIRIGSTLVMADLHIGYEESLEKEGVLLPRFHFKDLIKKVESMIKGMDRIVINGDIKDDFSRISDQEWRDSRKILGLLKRKAEVIIVRGNHDTGVDTIAEKLDVRIVDDIILDGFFITHGDIEKPLPKCHTVIIGHEHPSVSIREGGRVERFKCFVESTYKGKKLIVLPSMNLVTEGHDLTREAPISPYLKKSPKNRILVSSEGKILDFGNLENLKNI